MAFNSCSDFLLSDVTVKMNRLWLISLLLQVSFTFFFPWRTVTSRSSVKSQIRKIRLTLSCCDNRTDWLCSKTSDKVKEEERRNRLCYLLHKLIQTLTTLFKILASKFGTIRNLPCWISGKVSKTIESRHDETQNKAQCLTSALKMSMGSLNMCV